jgi:uncharacterized coiled-coil protein SlyX
MDEPTISQEGRIIELETRLTQQDQSLLVLSDELYRQQQQIAELASTVRFLAERVQAIASAEPAPNSEDEVPPHY